MEVITIEYGGGTVTVTRSAPNGHDFFENKPYHVAHHFKATVKGNSKMYNIWPFGWPRDLEKSRKQKKIEKQNVRSLLDCLQQFILFIFSSVMNFCDRENK